MAKSRLPIKYRLRVWVKSPALWRGAAGLLLVVSSLLSAKTAWEVDRNAQADLARSCRDRAASREDAKRGILGVADEASVVLGADDTVREQIRDRGSDRLDSEFPDLICEDGPPPSSSTSEPLPSTTVPEGGYLTCDEARAAGAAPVRRGDPGYAAHLDLDGDGTGCEGG